MLNVRMLEGKLARTRWTEVPFPAQLAGRCASWVNSDMINV